MDSTYSTHDRVINSVFSLSHSSRPFAHPRVHTSVYSHVLTSPICSVGRLSLHPFLEQRPHKGQ